MAEVSGAKYHYLDHDSDIVDEDPPVLNEWYEVFHDQDVRLIWCTVMQNNDETAAKDIEVRWTIDGTPYFRSTSMDDLTYYYVYRYYTPSTGGTEGLRAIATAFNAARYVDKRGHDFKVETRITSALGTNQRLRAWCVRETLELT